MRLVFGIGSGLLVIFALLIAGARQIGHRQERDHFPLPSADGCWQGLCLFEMSEEEIAEALIDHPDIEQCDKSQVNSGMDSTIYSFKTGCDAETPIIFVFLRMWALFSFQSDRTVPDNLPLTYAGNVIIARGSPDYVSLSGLGVYLIYADQGLEVRLNATNWRGDQAYLLPSDSIDYIVAIDPNYTDEYRGQIDPLAVIWHGFGTYHFER